MLGGCTELESVQTKLGFYHLAEGSIDHCYIWMFTVFSHGWEWVLVDLGLLRKELLPVVSVLRYAVFLDLFDILEIFECLELVILFNQFGKVLLLWNKGNLLQVWGLV